VLQSRGSGRPRGIVGTTVAPERGGSPARLLAEVFLPEPLRRRIETERPKRLLIVPDGALHQLPFEALLLADEPAPRYVLDAWPPIAYLPSAGILERLLERPAAASEGPVLLTIGDPYYRSNDPAVAAAGEATRNAFLTGQLQRLPGTGRECAAVAAVFGPDRALQFLGNEATEANVKRHAPGRRFLHLAAHGLVDEHWDNLFGGIALTPTESASTPAADDGLLSLDEIHELPIAGCELAVLSACQTSVGPDRPLEAGSTLARGFLAAGARRVVASLWSVADDSTAQLMQSLFRQIAGSAAESAGGVDYAAALQQARRQLRSNPKTADPYYWAPFILLGPAEGP
jgi:CHAT domain-containing protein